ncbi:MAG: hypothetical protein CO128_02130 [Ignavibacteriales bacterium CG_4_9_14_3_um_filter_30_11]|nr:MAG: hypothetical protein CO128_02130 [Ignavibacteriales bacterium CG_4_9_14_3_um_filter_30_11]
MKRRDFIKTGIVGVTALGSGIGVGNILLRERKIGNRFSAYAFLPSKEKIIINYLNLFRTNIQDNNFNNFLNNNLLDKIVNKKFIVTTNYLFTNKIIEIKLTKLTDKISSDIFLSNSKKLVLNPEKDFSISIFNFRNQIKWKSADCLLSIEMKEQNYLSDFIFQNEKHIIIENEKGIIDKISLAKNYSNIICPGEIGNTEVELSGGKIKIKDSPCRHKLCQKMSALNNTIACVPNKILIKTV